MCPGRLGLGPSGIICIRTAELLTTTLSTTTLTTAVGAPIYREFNLVSEL